MKRYEYLILKLQKKLLNISTYFKGQMGYISFQNEKSLQKLFGTKIQTRTVIARQTKLLKMLKNQNVI